MSSIDFAKENNYDMAANDSALEGNCSMVNLEPDEIRKIYKKSKHKEIDTESIES